MTTKKKAPAKKAAAKRKPAADAIACVVTGAHPIDGVETGGTVHLDPARAAAFTRTGVVERKE